MEKMKEYVCGFMFSEVGSQVVLIRKQKPEWQKGKLNGVGGKVEPGETDIDAMTREFWEETGVSTSGKDWTLFAIGREAQDSDSQYEAGAVVYFYKAYNDMAFYAAKTMETEEIEKIWISNLSTKRAIHNLNWLVPLALQEDVLRAVEFEWI
jgi:8-oxo-dGTP diphosphatase